MRNKSSALMPVAAGMVLLSQILAAAVIALGCWIQYLLHDIQASL